MHKKSNPCCRRRRRIRCKDYGAALIEFAVCLPILMMMIMGSIEAASAMYVKQALVTSAYEGARAAIRIDGTTTDANAKAQAVLDARQIKGSRITFTPSVVETAPRGSRVVVEVSAPFGQNSPFMGNVITDRSSVVRTTMIKE